ncbi:MAG: 6-phosphogluconolactonase [Nitriliruptoraceae bacterium]
MRVVIADDHARQAAAHVAVALREAASERGRATLAVSGGSTPGDLLEALAAQPLPWDRLHVFQVDERFAPAGHTERNLELLRGRLLADRPLPDGQVHPMPVDNPDPEAAAERYAAQLAEVAGVPPVLDVVQLGLGSDGHTASLLPGDPVVDVVDRDVAVTGSYGGWRRLTLTLPIIARARSLVWLVSGADKRGAVARLLAGDPAIPAGRVPGDRAVAFLDPAAAPDPPAS